MFLHSSVQANLRVNHLAVSRLYHNRVLVVDDDHSSVMAVSLMLERFGMHTHAANCGPAAIRCLREYKYDVVVTELQMPGMDGTELVGRIKQESTDIITVIITECGLFDVVDNMSACIVDAWLFKPFAFFELYKTLQRLTKFR